MKKRISVIGSALTICLALSTEACGSSQPALRVKASDPSTFAQAAPGQTVVVEFVEGDVVPLSFAIEGELFETRPAPPAIVLVAKRRFFVKIDDDGVRTSVDGESWGGSRKKGKLSFGLDFRPPGTSAQLRFVTPAYDK